jgi:hypothetical protein
MKKFPICVCVMEDWSGYQRWHYIPFNVQLRLPTCEESYWFFWDTSGETGGPSGGRGKKIRRMHHGWTMTTVCVLLTYLRTQIKPQILILPRYGRVLCCTAKWCNEPPRTLVYLDIRREVKSGTSFHPRSGCTNPQMHIWFTLNTDNVCFESAVNRKRFVNRDLERFRQPDTETNFK